MRSATSSASKLLLTGSLIIAASGFFLLVAKAQTTAEMQQEITNRNNQIAQLETEIKAYQKQLETTGQQKASLSRDLSLIETTRKKLAADIQLTSQKIKVTEGEIANLASTINTQTNQISADQQSIGESLRDLATGDQQSMIELLMASDKPTAWWNEVDRLLSLNKNLRDQIGAVKTAKVVVETKKTAAETVRAQLLSLKATLSDQQALAEQNRKAKAALLAQTKNQESGYKLLLADRLQKKNQVQAEIAKFEEAIKVALDPSRLPSTGSGILSWPVDKVVVTQYFGNTSFASKNPQVYKGQGHNGIDLGTPIGTPIKAALSGKVMGTGDTDTACAGASYGKWILIDHGNGLATLYAHLSLIRVAAGQTVGTGEVIGYSGMTGYSTGPHLHFTVMASQAATISDLKSKVPGCGTYHLPVSQSGFAGYLNPLSYL